jgi:radical SAM superfamily enzyme YgiQ (UPF0313 family)
MRILLVNPETESAKKGYSSAIFPPLGILYMASILREAKHDVKVIDYFVLSVKEDYNYDSLKKDILEFKPDIIGTSCFSSNIKYAENILDISKEVSPKTITIIGGPHITAVPNYLINIKSADYGIYGEAEYSLLEFADKLASKESINEIYGIIYRDGDIINFKKREFIKDLDALPLPARDLVPMELYQPSAAAYKQLPATTLITSRGCPYQCVFCHKPIFGNQFRPHSAEYVTNEMEVLHREFGVNDFRIYDDTFTLNRDRVIEICNILIKKNMDINWNCATRVDHVDYELLKIMKQAGCYNVSFGVESGTERVLKLIKKGVNKDQIKNAFKWTRKLEIESVAFFIIGLPTQTKEEVLETIKFAKELNPSFVQFTLVSPHPDTELYELCKKHGKTNIGDWSNLNTYSNIDTDLPFVPYTIPEKELKKLYRKAYISFYFRPRYLYSKLLNLFKSDKPISKLKRGISTIFSRV